MAEETWTKTFEVNGRTYEALFIRRPFREGLEVRIDVDGELLSVAEFGFGEMALLEKARSMVEEHLASRK